MVNFSKVSIVMYLLEHIEIRLRDINDFLGSEDAIL